MRDNPEIDFSSYIIKGVLKNYAYDGQSEGNRAQYVYDLISLSHNKEKIRKSILHGLATEQNDTWTLTHLFGLAKIYAQGGDVELRQAIYDRFLNHPIEGSDWVGFSEILELDGLQGLLFIAEKYGKWLRQNPDNWEDDLIIRSFQKENPDMNVWEEVKNASQTNPEIRLYLESIRKTANNQNYMQETVKYENIAEEIVNSKGFFPYQKKVRLTELEISEISTRLLSEKNKRCQEKLLYIFDTHKFLFDSNLILEFAKQKPGSKYRIAEFATNALKYLKSDNIRQFALTKIATAKRADLYTDILVSNYQSGDFRILTDMARKFKSEHIIESIASSYINIFKVNKTKECKDPLEYLYSKMNCGIHRNALIEVLIETDVLSDRLSEEIRYDSYPGTRKLSERFTAKNRFCKAGDY